ncbi:MAG: UDP-glucose 4-epimerase GalE [Dehalococcoidia bacterium]|nr:UDP-glucose 4-epimerase GalE [Dehalococcoidia bacterium]
MNVLVTGGAGYVGSIVTGHLLQQKHKVIVVDNLQQGHKEAVLPPAEFVLTDICDTSSLESAFRRFKIDAVMHMAAETVVEYSMTDPKRYFHTNLLGGMNLLNAMLKHGVDRIIYSSTAAVYGEPHGIPIEEDHPETPINSYGESKLMFERILDWYGRAYGLKHISFRYFCAAGATELLGEDHRPETHLIPNVLKAALNEKNAVSVFGTDYPTEDGSCIRDFVHVVDIARAHLVAMEKIDSLNGNIYNLGNGKGYSVLEVIKIAEKVAGVRIPVKSCPRRLGDPAILVASADRAMRELGWKPQFSRPEDIIESAWQWLKGHPDGYKQ